MAPTVLTFTVTSSPQRLIATYTPACKLMVSMNAGGSGIGWIGPSTLDASGNNHMSTLDAAAASVAGGSFSIEDATGWNGINVADYKIHGATPGDVVAVVYHTA